MENELLNFENLLPVLEEYAERAKLIYKSEVTTGGHNASNDLINSLKTRVQVDKNVYEVVMDLNFYWKFLEGGTRGKEKNTTGRLCRAHFPPVSAILKWVQIKPVIPRPDASGKIPSQKSLAFLIARKIEREGIEPFPALAKTKEQLREEFTPKLNEALGKDAALYLSQLIRKAQ